MGRRERFKVRRGDGCTAVTTLKTADLCSLSGWSVWSVSSSAIKLLKNRGNRKSAGEGSSARPHPRPAGWGRQGPRQLTGRAVRDRRMRAQAPGDLPGQPVLGWRQRESQEVPFIGPNVVCWASVERCGPVSPEGPGTSAGRGRGQSAASEGGTRRGHCVHQGRVSCSRVAWDGARVLL